MVYLFSCVEQLEMSPMIHMGMVKDLFRHAL